MSNPVQELPAEESRCRGIACPLRTDCRRHLSWLYGLAFVKSTVTNFTREQDGSCTHQIPREQETFDHKIKK